MAGREEPGIQDATKIVHSGTNPLLAMQIARYPSPRAFEWDGNVIASPTTKAIALPGFHCKESDRHSIREI
jgi:hypothetical protein